MTHYATLILALMTEWFHGKEIPMDDGRKMPVTIKDYSLQSFDGGAMRIVVCNNIRYAVKIKAIGYDQLTADNIINSGGFHEDAQ